MKISPIGAFGAMAYTIGNFGLKSLGNLGLLMVAVYITMFLFVVFILGAIAKFFDSTSLNLSLISKMRFS